MFNKNWMTATEDYELLREFFLNSYLFYYYYLFKLFILDGNI